MAKREMARFYRAQERAFAPGIVDWPDVLSVKTHGRLLRVDLIAVVAELRSLGYRIQSPRTKPPVSEGSEPTMQPKPDYDTQRLEAVLVTCQKCGQAFYMTHPQPVCIACRRKA